MELMMIKLEKMQLMTCRFKTQVWKFQNCTQEINELEKDGGTFCQNEQGQYSHMTTSSDEYLDYVSLSPFLTNS